MKNCCVCGAEIPAERLEALPDTTTCVGCSREQKVLGFTFSRFSKGTGSELALVKPSADPEALRRAIRANKRRR